MAKKRRKTGGRQLAAFTVSVFIFLLTLFSVILYCRRTPDAVYDFSMGIEDGQEWGGSNGWHLYINEEGKTTELTPDGFGGYMGLRYPGQTYYYSRTLEKGLNSPSLQIGAVNQTISIFLDGSLIYTDCPDADNRIGYLELPMLDFDRQDPIRLSLPPDCGGKELTIAQSSPVFSELQTEDGGAVTVWPCEVELYCGYSYESGLIASTAKAMIPVVFLFALELLLLAAFIWNAWMGHFYPQLPVFSLALIFQIWNIFAQTDFFFYYFGVPVIDLVRISLFLSIGVFLLFAALYAGRFLPFFLALTVIHLGSCLLYCLTQLGYLLPYGELYVWFLNLPQRTGFLCLIAAFAGAFYLSRKGFVFFRRLSRTFAAILVVFLLFFIIRAPFAPEITVRVISTLKSELISALPHLALRLLWRFTLLASLITVCTDLASKAAGFFEENALLSAKNELALESYENLRRQADEVMMIRHDTMKHYLLLQTMVQEEPERAAGYLDELIGQAKQVRPVISSRNHMLDILLNAKLHEAAQKGIHTEIQRTDAPARLPLSDAELCCLILNIMDNGIQAAACSQAEQPYIRLDFHCKNENFVFSCENSRKAQDEMKKEKAPVKEHGYGMKIIRQIMGHWEGELISVEETGSEYGITVIIPLSS